MSSPPTITTNNAGTPSGAGAGNTRIYLPTDGNPPFRYFGGRPQPYFTTARRFGVITLKSGGNLENGTESGMSWRVEFATNAATVSIGVTGSSQPYRYLVDGQYVDMTGTTTSAGGTHWHHLPFGSRAAGFRTITLEGHGAQAFYGVAVGPNETVKPSPATDLRRLIVIGDSNTAATGIVNSIHAGDAFPYVLGDHLGFRDVRGSGQGGQGYTTASSATVYSLLERLDYDLQNQGADAVLFAMGQNDPDTAALDTGAQAVLARARVLCPTQPIFVAGPFNPAGGPSAAGISKENRIFAAVDALGGDPAGLIKIPVLTASEGALVTGTGKIGTTTGSGTSDILTAADGSHLSDEGHVAMGAWLADAILSACATSAWLA